MVNTADLEAARRLAYPLNPELAQAHVYIALTRDHFSRLERVSWPPPSGPRITRDACHGSGYPAYPPPRITWDAYYGRGRDR